MELAQAGRFVNDDTVLSTYEAFYRKLVYRDRVLPRPWVFTTNYDLYPQRKQGLSGPTRIPEEPFFLFPTCAVNDRAALDVNVVVAHGDPSLTELRISLPRRCNHLGVQHVLSKTGCSCPP